MFELFHVMNAGVERATLSQHKSNQISSSPGPPLTLTPTSQTLLLLEVINNNNLETKKKKIARGRNTKDYFPCLGCTVLMFIEGEIDVCFCDTWFFL